jgi:hypothetical protein
MTQAPRARAAAQAAPRLNVNAIVAQAIAALQQRQREPTPPSADMPADLLATAEILGQGPGLRRPLGAAGTAVVDAWVQAAAAPAAERVTILRGNGQVTLAGTALPVTPAIVITDGFGRPRQGVLVSFTIPVGGGSIATASSATDEDGVATPGIWTLGPTPGQYQLQFRVGSRILDFVAFAVPTRRLEILRGDGQPPAPASSALPIEPAVKVVDARTGQPLDGLNVTFIITAGRGGIGNATAVTDPDGIATGGSWTLGPAAGRTNELKAAVEGANPVVFTAQASP